MDELGLAALKQYCLSTKLTVEEFGQPRIYADPKYDVCIEYVTRLGVSPKHVFLIFIEDGRVVERQRFLEYESTKGADGEVSGISPQESRLEPDAGDRTENEDNGD